MKEIKNVQRPIKGKKQLKSHRFNQRFYKEQHQKKNQNVVTRSQTEKKEQETLCLKQSKDAMKAQKFITAYKNGKTLPDVSGLCGRISEGNSEVDFTKLSRRAGRKIVYLAGADLLSHFFNKTALEILIFVGITVEQVDQYVKRGCYWRLFVFPETQAYLASWEGLFKFTRELYGEEIYMRLLPFKEELKTTAYENIKGHERLIELSNTTTEEEKWTHPEFMLSKQFLSVEKPTLYHARGFFHHTLGVNQLYIGDGTNLSGYDEFVCQNFETKDIEGLSYIDIKVSKEELQAYRER